MEEVQQAVVESAKALYKEYVNKGLRSEHPFKGVGTQYILFSVNEPKLFQLLFMTERPELSGILPLIEESYEEILSSLQGDYGISELLAEKLYNHLTSGYIHTASQRFVPPECAVLQVLRSVR